VSHQSYPRNRHLRFAKHDHDPDEVEKNPERDLVTVDRGGRRFSIDSVLQQELSVTLLYFEITALIKSGTPQATSEGD
jgi:hypothetical protein